MKLKDKILGKIEAIAFGGEGILRADGRVVFVPFVNVGDVVEVVITEVKKSFARGEVLRTVTFSKHQIEPKCSHFRACGGCQFQHVPYGLQLSYKQDFVKQSLSRIGGFSSLEVLPVIGAGRQWNYRKVVRLKVRWLNEHLTLGYVDFRSRDLINVAHCPIFYDDKKVWSQIRNFFESIFHTSSEFTGSATIFNAARDKFVIHLDGSRDFGNIETITLPDYLQGFLFTSRQKTTSIGDTTLCFKSSDYTFRHTPQSFVQNHDEQSAKIYNDIIDTVVGLGARRIFDLYCGFGVTSTILSKQGIDVIAVESNPESVKLANTNAADNHATARFVCEDVGVFLNEKDTLQMNPDLIIVNPPRTGLNQLALRGIVEIRPRFLIYVSCMPQTLARDLKSISEAGYVINRCQPYDMFPQTTHVETLTVLSLAL